MGSQIQGSGSLTIEEIYSQLIVDNKDLETKTTYSHPFKTNGKAVRMSLGRIWFNQLLPDDYILIDEPVDKNRMDDIIKDMIIKYDPEKVADILSELQKESFKMATLVPNTFQIDTLIIPDEIQKDKKDFIKKYKDIPAKEIDINQFTKDATIITKKLLKHLDEKGYKLQNILNSKAKGTIGDWKSLLISKGFVLDVEGNIRGPILRGISDGYNQLDYFDAASEARRNYYYKSTMTAKPGYLARKVIMSNANVLIDSSKKDCGTKKYLEIFIDEQKSNLLLGRNYIEGNDIVNITKDVSKLLNKNIKLRSPMYCHAKKGICPTCYGNHYKNLNTNNIGILAGGAINMVAINSLMKMRHKSSQISIIDVNFIDLIKNTGEDKAAINKLIDVRRKEIIAKQDCTILLDKSQYDESDLIDTGTELFLPGIINLYIGELSQNKFITLPFNFQVHLSKPENFVVDGKTIVLRYTPGEKILSQDYYTEQTEPGIIDRLLGGALKYIDSPEALLEAVHKQLPSIDLVHLELVVSNMFRMKDDITIPCRLKNYKNFEIVGIKKLPHINSWLTGLSFEDPNKAIKEALLKQTDNDMNPIEKVLLEKFYDQNERNRRDEP